MCADVCKAPVSFIVKKCEWHSDIRSLRAIRSHTADFTLFLIGKRKLGVVRNHQVQKAIPVEIEPGCACRPAFRVLYAGLLGYVREGSIAIVVKQCAKGEPGNVEIGETVIVKVRHGHAHPIETDTIDPGFRSQVFEFPIPKISVQRISNR